MIVKSIIDSSETVKSDAIATDAVNIVFASSSGHCSLDCSYCIIDVIAKHQPTLDYGDFAYLLEQLNGKTIFMLSGKGDFFAGYRKNDKLLARLLDHDDVEVALDINGVMIHEFPELDDAKLEKVRRVNLTLHYLQVLNKRALEVWKKNALIMLSRKGHDNVMMGTILSPPEMYLWEESLEYYKRNVFDVTGHRIVMIRDVDTIFDQAAEAKLAELTEAYAPMVAEVRQQDFSAVFKGREDVLCPAGKDYFRIWNDGSVQGCP
jgi:MoaA/NifB/PqqE/SkfB family radical SAM enzyme